MTPVNEPEDPSVLSLMAEYGITVEQARAQMEQQVEAGRAEQDLPPELLATYSGRQISHDRGGLVTVAITNPTLVPETEQHFVKHGVDNVDVRTVLLTHTELDDLIGQLRERLRESRLDGSSPLLDVGIQSLGMITLQVSRGMLNATEADIVNMALASPGIYQLMYVDSLPRSFLEACNFADDIECDPPLRGSVRILDGGDICTAGFVARSVSDDKPYVLTAGHCNDGAGDWKTGFASGEDHIIGAFHNSRYNLALDAGIIRVNNPSGWQFGFPWVTVDPSGGQPERLAYPIYDVLSPGLEDRVCATLGNTARTDLRRGN